MKRGLFIKNVLLVCLAVLFTLCLAACAAPAAKQQDTIAASSEVPIPTPIATPEPAPIVVFTDSALETKVREQMGKPEGDITLSEASAVVKLDLSNESPDVMNSKNGGIHDISDLRYFTSLEDLNLSYNEIHDLSPLAELTTLKYLGFTGILPDDLSVLKGLTNLIFLGFDWTCEESERLNGTLSLAFMADMKDLEIFSCMGNGVQDISALGGLTKIWSLFLNDNAITDISALANLTNLTELKLDGNPIQDYSPLNDIYPMLGYADFEMR
jgi:Leucine-rich repeat (LRR) protein